MIRVSVVKRLRGGFDAIRRRWRWLDLLISVFRKGSRDGAGRLAAVVSYYSFFSLFPLLLVLVFVLGTLLSGSWKDRILDSALSNFPVIGTQITVGKLEGSGVALAIGLVTALWAGTHAFDAFDQSMDVVWNGTRVKQRSMISRRIHALVQLGVLGGALVLTTAATVVLNTVVKIPGADTLVSVVSSVALNIAFALTMYRVVDGKDRGWRAHVPGAITAGVGLTALQLGGQFYLTRLIDGAGDTYGIFAVVIGLLSWLNLMASLMIWSAELSAVMWLRKTRADGLRRARATVGGRKLAVVTLPPPTLPASTAMPSPPSPPSS